MHLPNRSETGPFLRRIHINLINEIFDIPGFIRRLCNSMCLFLTPLLIQTSHMAKAPPPQEARAHHTGQHRKGQYVSTPVSLPGASRTMWRWWRWWRLIPAWVTRQQPSPTWLLEESHHGSSTPEGRWDDAVQSGGDPYGKVSLKGNVRSVDHVTPSDRGVLFPGCPCVAGEEPLCSILAKQGTFLAGRSVYVTKILISP